MANNERKPGESNKQYLDRIKAQKKEQRIQEETNRVKSQEDYGGELEPAVLMVEQNPATISQGYQTVGRRNNDHRVGQKSVFGEREYNAHPSLAQRLGNWITDGLHLTSPPTMQDGYGRTLNAEVPTWESAQGQELKRMGKTAMTDAAIVAAPFGLYQFYVNPLAMTAAVGSGTLVDQGVKAGLNEVNDQLNESGKQLSENQQNAIRAAVGLFSGNKVYKWGDRATKRGLEVAMHTTGVSNPVPDLTRGWKMRSLSQKKDVLNYIITGKNKNGNSNTLGAVLKNKEVIPTFYTGLNGAENQITIPKYGHDAVRTYLYGEPLLSFKSIKNPELGVHSDYVLNKYPNKKIRVFESQESSIPLFRNTPEVEPVSIGAEGIIGPISSHDPLPIWKRTKSSFSDNVDFDASGHLLEKGMVGKDLFTREQDIWKYNADDYLKRWNKSSNPIKKEILRWGLNIVDHHGTPFIVRTPWYEGYPIRPENKPSILDDLFN